MMRVLVVLALLVQAAPVSAQDSDADPVIEYIQSLEERILALERENEALRTVLEDLERLISELRSPQGAQSPDITAGVEGKPAFLVEEVRRYDPAPERARIAEIDKEIEAIEKDVAAATKQVSADRTRPKNVRGLGATELTRLNLLIASGNRNIYNLKVESARISRELRVPRFWIMGWDGEQDIMLLTTRDEAELMRLLRQGDVVQWVGDVVDYALGGGESMSYQTIVSSRVWRVESGSITVTARPKERKPVWVPLANATPGAGTKSTPLPHLPTLPKK